MVRMNVGPSDIANNTFKPTMGKRGLGDVLFEDCNKETEVVLRNVPRLTSKMVSLFIYQQGWWTNLVESNENTELGAFGQFVVFTKL